MKKMMKLAMMVALTAFAAACSNQDDMPNNEKGSTEFSVEGVINGYEEVADSRAEAQTVVRIKWNGNETVYVYDGTACIGSLTAQPDANNAAIAKLSGTLTDAPSGKPLTLVYSPLFTEEPTVEGGKLTLDLSTQSTSKVPFLIYGVLTELEQEVSNKVVSFNFATSVYKCNGGNLDKEGTISQATIDHINTKCVLTLSDSAAPTVGGAEEGTITITNGFTSADERVIFTFALPVSDEATERTITVTKHDKEHTATFSKSAIAAAQSFNGVYVFEEAGSGSGTAAYVDINGVRWATMNYGATTVAGDYNTCAGDFYQWGALETIYDSKTCQYQYSSWRWSFEWKSEYGSNWFYENRIQYPDAISGFSLPDSRDVVMQNLDGWRTPTEGDYYKLITACMGALPDPDTWQDAGATKIIFSTTNGITTLSSSNPTGGIYILSEDQNYLTEYAGVEGMLFVEIADPTKRVFFPFGVSKVGSSMEATAGGGCYCMVKNYMNGNNRSIYVGTSGVGVCSESSRRYGFPIRPVQTISNN